MNDFTKEELQHLLHLCSSIPIDDIILIHKLRQMIDDYCEHKRCGLGECNNYPEECLRCNKKCNKCGEMYYDKVYKETDCD
jgi:hypothetical protein